MKTKSKRKKGKKEENKEKNKECKIGNKILFRFSFNCLFRRFWFLIFSSLPFFSRRGFSPLYSQENDLNDVKSVECPGHKLETENLRRQKHREAQARYRYRKMQLDPEEHRALERLKARLSRERRRRRVDDPQHAKKIGRPTSRRQHRSHSDAIRECEKLTTRINRKRQKACDPEILPHLERGRKRLSRQRLKACGPEILRERDWEGQKAEAVAGVIPQVEDYSSSICDGDNSEGASQTLT